MTVHVHVERVVVDGPLPSAPHLWCAALAREVAAALETGATPLGPAGPASVWPAEGARLAALRTSYVSATEGAATTPSPRAVGAAVGGALSRGVGGRA